MEKIDDPSISAVLLEQSSFSQVEFNSVEKFYVPGRDVTCYYTFTQQLIPRRKDWIGIFKVGWKTTREYYTFMWAALPKDLSKESTKQQEVQFKAYYLPKDDEYYQFCYVDQDGLVRGASTPFQFRPESEEDIVVVTTKGKVEEIEQQNEQLLRENQELKDSCADLQKQNSDVQAELQRKQEKLEALQSITKKLEQQVEEQKACWETELLQLKEDNQKISSENKEMRLRIDQLQVQLSTSEKDMEELVLKDQDNREQLQHLKNQNSQLILTLTGQKEQQRKLELTVEKMKQKETAAMKRQQELMDENFDLSRKLIDNKMESDVLKKEKERVERENNSLKRDNNRLMNYMGLQDTSESIDSKSPHQKHSSDQGADRQSPGLVYRNPYSGIQESSAPNSLAVKKCLRLGTDFGDGVCDHTSEQQQMQTHFLNCPICDQAFPAKEKQVFEDHVLCHSF